MNAVQGTWERATITKNGRPAAVLIAPDDLASLIETLEILSYPEVLAAVHAAEAGRGRRGQAEPGARRLPAVPKAHDMRPVAVSTLPGQCPAQVPRAAEDEHQYRPPPVPGTRNSAQMRGHPIANPRRQLGLPTQDNPCGNGATLVPYTLAAVKLVHGYGDAPDAKR